MAKLTEAQKRKNFEATVGSSENDMGPLPKKEKKYEDYDLSTPEKRGYAVRKAIFDTTDDKYRRDGSNELGNSMYNTGPERNIGPRMDSEGVKNRKPIPGETLTSSKKREGEWEAGFNKAKAETENVGPKMKKGGTVKKYSKGGSTASKRADGIATKGKTRGRMI
jgi:hypothetical protein